MTLQETKILPGATVTMIATSSEVVELLKQHEAKVKERVILTPSQPRSTQKPSLNKYTFKSIEALSEFPDKQRALEYLQRLKDDRGVCAIMEKHRWEVGALIELSPSERTILGYNRNKGQTIAVRLRTDDLTGFIHYPSVKKVLLHELAHMEFSEHDKDFHQLNRQLNKEVLELDWTQSKSRMTNPSAEAYNGPGFLSTSFGGGKRLGGTRINMSNFNNNLEYRREVISKAVELRLSKEEEDLTLSCGAPQNDTVPRSDSKTK
ncbi:hypothetical protein DSO57_1035025 [Entomophthora muscae]|uniref:Uncharacterized protein n=1 Tax=Entomophthora muscae TaxID=34485 RepID=A0ACC2REG8_9FUNG|nr:hypothetical protein DSO57_1035025 [Entomophthora muscae]